MTHRGQHWKFIANFYRDYARNDSLQLLHSFNIGIFFSKNKENTDKIYDDFQEVFFVLFVIKFLKVGMRNVMSLRKDT